MKRSWTGRPVPPNGLVAGSLLAAAFVAYGIWGFRATAVLGFAVRSSTPLALAAMCGILCERTGVINISIEGQMLLGAFAGFFGAAAFGVVAGVAAAVVLGALVGAFLALCAVTWRVDQIIAHHHDRLAVARAACRDATAMEVLSAIFPRALDRHQVHFAIGETLAHLNYLIAENGVERVEKPGQADRYRAVAAA